jgi:nucleoside-diphosphate-sugar epimerase
MQILVTGGTGFLGQHLARALLTREYGVRIAGRDMSTSQELIAAGAQPIVADLRDGAAIMAACAGVDAVFHVGALSAPWGNRRDFFAINVDGTAHVIDGCRAHNVQRLIYVSSPSVLFDGKDQHDLTDDAPYPRRFATVYSLTKKLGEDLVNQSGLATVTLRPKAIFGPGDRALLPRLVDAARRGRLPQIGNGRNLVDLTYVDNVVHALVLALDAHGAPGNTYTITNDEHVPLWNMIKTVLRRLGINDQLRRVPLPAALAAATLMEAHAVVTKQEPTLTRYTAAILGRTQTYNISAAKRDLGYEPLVAVTEGVECTLAALKEPTP